MIKRVSLILSVVGLVSLPSIVFKSSLLALPANTRMDSFPENFFLIYYSMYFIYIQAVFLNKLTFIVIYPHSGDLHSTAAHSMSANSPNNSFRPDSPTATCNPGTEDSEKNSPHRPGPFWPRPPFSIYNAKYRAMAAFYLPQPCIFAENSRFLEIISQLTYLPAICLS